MSMNPTSGDQGRDRSDRVARAPAAAAPIANASALASGAPAQPHERAAAAAQVLLEYLFKHLMTDRGSVNAGLGAAAAACTAFAGVVLKYGSLRLQVPVVGLFFVVIVYWVYYILRSPTIAVSPDERDHRDALVDRGGVSGTQLTQPNLRNIAARAVNPKFLVMAFVSGKGGVGKTWLALNSAYLVARKTKTLLIDLDFFNRGSSAILASRGAIAAHIPAPVFAPQFSEARHDDWQIRQADAAANLYYIDFPLTTLRKSPIPQDGLFNELAKALRAFIERAAAAVRAECVVLDCHGGPDWLSFAAAAAADTTFVISEPERASITGTMNFLAELFQTAEGCSVDLRLVYNRVGDDFSSRFLEQTYRNELQRLFDDHTLAGVFYVERGVSRDYLTCPFYAKVNPYGAFSKKLAAMLRSTAGATHLGLLPLEVQCLSARTLARQLRLRDRANPVLDLRNIGAIVSVFGFLALLSMLSGALQKITLVKVGWPFLIPFLKEIESIGEALVGGYLTYIAVFWLGIAVVFAWSRKLDRLFTRLSRLDRTWSLLVITVIILAVDMLPLVILGLMTLQVVALLGDSPYAILLIFSPLIIGAYGVAAHLLIDQVRKAWDGLYVAQKRLEATLRGAIVAYAVILPIASAFAFRSLA